MKVAVSVLSRTSRLTGTAETSEFDALTGTLTRPAFLRQMSEAAEIARQALAPFCICLIDVDQLRNVNEIHGQQCGDEVVLETAFRLRRVLSSTARHPNGQLLGRYDGNSFALLAQRCDLHQGVAIAERIRDEIASSPIADGIVVTVSAGVSQHRIGESTDDTLARAEQALHLAKQFGRDRVEVLASPSVRAESDSVIAWERSA